MTDSDAASSMGRRGEEPGWQSTDQRFERVKEYVGNGADAIGNLSGNLTEFVRKEPWIAVVAAFAVGYLAARMMRHVTA
jgi:hypothetical protein